MIHSDLANSQAIGSGERSSDCKRLDYEGCARALILDGYCTIKVPAHLTREFWRIVDCRLNIPLIDKESFSFPDNTDGFLPYGMEYARSTKRVDLCERFCYRHKYRLAHSMHSFSRSPMYEAVVQCETALWEIAGQVLNAVIALCDSTETVEIRDSSYLQLCSYDLHYRCKDREYLQDRHEDGNLITLVKASCDGLVIFPDGMPRKVELAEDEIIMFAGSLLTTLSDGRIPYMDHAVLSPPQDQLRTSLVYFVLPEVNRIYKTLKSGKYIDLGILANELHESFGNRPFADSCVRDGRQIDE
jgi:hypothetical protein